MEDRSFLSILTCAHGEHFWAPSTSPQNWGHLSWWGQSKRPHLNLCRDMCVLFGTGSCMAILSAEQRASRPTFRVNQFDYPWWKTANLRIQYAWRHGNLPSVTSVTKTVLISFQGDFKLKPPPWVMFQGGRGMRLPFDSSKFSHQTVSTTQTPLYYTIARYILIEIHFFIVSTQIGQ